MKKFLAYLLLPLFILSSCDTKTPEGTKITKEEALQAAESITRLYQDRYILISNETIGPKTKLKYNGSGDLSVNSNYKTFKSPDFESWLIVIGPDFLTNFNECTHIFVNAYSKEFETMILNGQAIVKWDENLSYYPDKTY